MRIMFVAAMIAMAPTAAAAEPFCEDLRTVLAAGDERPAPYDSLVAPDKRMYNGKLASFAPATALRGLPEGATCSRYLAGVAESVVGGGTHNYIECRLARGQDVEGPNGNAASTTLKATRKDLTDRIIACLGSDGWGGGQVKRVPAGRLSIERAMFTTTGGQADIMIEMEATPMGRRAGEYRTNFTLTLQVRTPTLYKAPQ